MFLTLVCASGTEAFEILKQKKFCARLTCSDVHLPALPKKPIPAQAEPVLFKHTFEGGKLVFSPLLKHYLFFLGVIVLGTQIADTIMWFLGVGKAAEALVCCWLQPEVTGLNHFLPQVSARYQEQKNSHSIC